ncbi:MAG: pseudouridine synthase, partial [Desulfomicrobium sp.]|nr:pseudouridine synthase [Desulfomicrobium sp.]
MLALSRGSPYLFAMPENTPVRLNKYLADAGLASRRGADALIQSGRVSVNGLSQREPGTRVIPGQDTVLLDGNPVAARQDAPASYVMLHKPVHTVTTVNDPQGRRTVVEMLPEDLRTQRLFPVGRLDYMSEGLLLLTNDGDVTLRLTHPSYEHAKKYEVVVREAVTENSLRTMRQGMRLREGERLAPVEVETSVEGNGATLLRMTLRQGVNRQIRRMCRDLNLTILRLRRVELGPLRLEG